MGKAFASPRRLELLDLLAQGPRTVEVIGPDELTARLRRRDVVLVDVRPPEEFEAGHIDGARSIPLEELEQRLDQLPADTEVVAYCRGPFCAYAHEAVRQLRAAGRPARRLEAGWPEWQLAHEKTDAAPQTRVGRAHRDLAGRQPRRAGLLPEPTGEPGAAPRPAVPDRALSRARGGRACAAVRRGDLGAGTDRSRCRLDRAAPFRPAVEPRAPGSSRCAAAAPQPHAAAPRLQARHRVAAGGWCALCRRTTHGGARSRRRAGRCLRACDGGPFLRAIDSPRCVVAVARDEHLSLIHISEPTRRTPISYAVFCLQKKKK